MGCIMPAQKLQAQYVAIPDTNFVAWLNANGYAGCMNGNLMDTTCAAVVNADSVWCFVSRKIDITGIQYFHRLQFLDCNNDSLQTLPSPLPDSLKTILISGSTLSSLPALPKYLTYLNLASDQLTSLPLLPSSLTTLWCNENQLSSLPTLPSGLTFLKCSVNKLTSLPTLPLGLANLDCSYNQLINLPALPLADTVLNCTYNQLTSLPIIPSGLVILDCSNNQLANLPVLSSSLRELYCYSNQLTTMPTLPSGLTTLDCGLNQLASLPTLPSGLTTLYCGPNQLTILPILPSGLTILDCGINLLTALPDLPNCLTTFRCYNNPNLTCLPLLTRIYELDFLNTAVACIPNYGMVTYSNPLLSSLPYCYLSNPNNCTDFSDINTINASLTFSLLPNPAHNYLTIQTENTTGALLQLNDMQGRQILTANLSSSNYRLDTGHLSAGLYLVKVIDLNGRSGVRKLVIE